MMLRACRFVLSVMLISGVFASEWGWAGVDASSLSVEPDRFASETSTTADTMRFVMSSGIRKSDCKQLGGDRVKVDGMSACAVFAQTCPAGWQRLGDPVTRMRKVCGPVMCTGRNSQGDCIRSAYCKTVEAPSVICAK